MVLQCTLVIEVHKTRLQNVRNSQDFVCRVHQLINSGESDVYLHALGAAIPRALNLALKVKKYYGEQVSLDTATNTVELTDDFERIVQNSKQKPLAPYSL